jgi:leucyl aminopeptidase
MEIKGSDTLLLNYSGEALAIAFFEDQVELTGDLATLNQQFSGIIADLIAEEEFKGKAGSTSFTRVTGKVSKIFLVGLGKNPVQPALKKEENLNSLRNAAAAIARLAKKHKIKSLGFVGSPGILPVVDNQSTTAEVIAEGFILALHQDTRFKSESEDKPAVLEAVELIGLGDQTEAIAKAEKICSGVILARELVTAPSNVVTPISLAETALSIAQEYGLEAEILEEEDCEKLGMGSFLGVAKASDLPPKFIHLTYKPEGTPRRKLAIVGKGLTFDSGGYNLKPTGSGIETMKIDMGGAGATLGAAKAIAQIKPDVEVHFISAATENMISGKGMHPGDILTASNGKTIEINNTDAEGRLTLADALVFAEKLGVEAIVDLATLTGACIVALGDDISGLWSTDETLAHQLKEASAQAGEKFWQMPLEEKYWDLMKSDIADMKNTGSRSGGAITAALFLKQFVKETPWAHLDVAGPVWTEKEAGVNNKGATGFPVRTLVNWILS